MKAFPFGKSFYLGRMLFLVNCQNAFMEKCDSKRLRVIVEAAGLMERARVINWSSPPEVVMGKVEGIDWNPDYQNAIYPEIAKLNLPTINVPGLERLPREFYEEIKQSTEIYLAGGNVESWIVGIALEMWNTSRIRPILILEGWFSVGAVGTHVKAINELSRHFGVGIFRSWDIIKEPILKKKAEQAAHLAKAFPS